MSPLKDISREQEVDDLFFADEMIQKDAHAVLDDIW